MSRSRRFALVAGLALAALFAFPAVPHAAGGRVRMVATLPNLGSIASEIAGDRIELTVIASGAQDAHFVDPKPSYIMKLRNADLLLVNGLDLEIGWVPPLTQGARNPRILLGGPGYVDCSAGIQVIEIPLTMSRVEGDVHPYGNPHYLTDPLTAEVVAGTISAALKRVDPAGAEAYEAGRRSFVSRLHKAVFGADLVGLAGGARLSREAAAGTLDSFLDDTSVGGVPLRKRLGGWLGKMQAVRGRPVITYHKDYSYFARRFGIRVADYVEPKPGIQPSAKHLEDLLQLLSRGDIHLVLTRPYVEHRSTDSLAKKTGVKVITIPLEVGGAPEATDYFRLFDFAVDGIVRALAGGPPAPGR